MTFATLASALNIIAIDSNYAAVLYEWYDSLY